MSFWQAALLAVIQGLTEFLPVSSSAHLALAPWLLGWPDQGLAFDIALHIGTLAAVLIYFGRDWARILASGLGLRRGEAGADGIPPRLLWMLAAASVPIGVFGLLLKEHAETTFRSPVLMGCMLIGVGLLMWFADRAGTRERDIRHLSWVDAIAIGTAQALAIVPGTSRSGITIVAGLLRNLDRAAAARFSFLLSTPAVAAAGAKAWWDLQQQGGIPPGMMVPVLTGIALSTLTGLAAIGFLLGYLRRASLQLFVYYRVIFGIIVIALAVLLRSPGE